MLDKKDVKVTILNCSWKNVSLNERYNLYEKGEKIVILPAGKNYIVFSPFSEFTRITVPNEWRKTPLDELAKKIGVEGIVRFGADNESIVMNSLANAQKMAEVLISI